MKWTVDIPALLRQYRAMLGETENRFSLRRAALGTSGGAKSKVLAHAWWLSILLAEPILK